MSDSSDEESDGSQGRVRSRSFIVEDGGSEDDIDDVPSADETAYYGRSRGNSFAVSAPDLGSLDNSSDSLGGGGGRSRGTSFAISPPDESQSSRDSGEKLL